jgi:putative ABC transport system permease protein
MPQLSTEHINYIIKDLHYRGLVYEPLQNELVDHICSSVETEMEQGKKFIDAYQEVLKSFGHTKGLRETQHQTIHSENSIFKAMLKNYLTIAFRNLRKQSFYSIINITGLAVGIASCLVIVLYIFNELSYDKYNTNADRIYRIDSEILFNGNHLQMVTASAPMGPAMKEVYPEVENMARIREEGTMLVKRSLDNIRETNVVYADSTIFNVLTIPLTSGNPKTALVEPNTLVLSESTAAKLFPNNEDPIGQTLILDNQHNFKITGVYKDIPRESHFHFSMMLSMEGYEASRSDEWLSHNFVTYLLLRDGASAQELQAKFPKLIDIHVTPMLKQMLGPDVDMDAFLQAGNKLDYTLRPLLDIHLHSDLSGEFEPNSDITYVYLFGAVALFILLIACINFMNLSTARSANRAKEVGMRKVMGSLRLHLVNQFLMESILLSLFAFVIALLLAYLAMPFFNDLAGRQITIPWTNPAFVTIVFGVSILIGIFAGTYPAFFLSAFRPINVLKGNMALGMKSGLIRSGLVVFQFSISIILIIGTFTVQQQLSYIQQKKIGFNKDQVIVIQDAYAMGDQLQSFKDEVIKSAAITNGSISGFLPVAGTSRNDNVYWPEGTDPSQNNMVSLQVWSVDQDYVPTLGMEIIDGRNFSRDFPSDSGAVIINEAALKMFNFTEDPIGKKIATFGGGMGPDGKPNSVSFQVIGTLKDFHFESLKQSITPVALFLRKSTSRISFRFEAANTQDVINTIQNTWARMAPGQPFQYTFLDQAFGKMYDSEQRLGKIFAVFAGLAILVASLGLFALTSFTAEQRNKEIGIRKVLGASVSSIVMLLSKEFGKLIIVAFILSVPIAWYAVNWWLESYMYKVEVGVLVYLLAGLASFLIAWITMGYQSMKAASSNPIDALRSE